MTETERIELQRNLGWGLRTLAYVARCASVDADKLGLPGVSIELAGAVDAANRASQKLTDARVRASVERFRAEVKIS